MVILRRPAFRKLYKPKCDSSVCRSNPSASYLCNTWTTPAVVATASAFLAVGLSLGNVEPTPTPASMIVGTCSTSPPRGARGQQCQPHPLQPFNGNCLTRLRCLTAVCYAGRCGQASALAIGGGYRKPGSADPIYSVLRWLRSTPALGARSSRSQPQARAGW